MKANVRIEMMDGKKYDFITEGVIANLSPLKIKSIVGGYMSDFLRFRDFGLEDLHDKEQITGEVSVNLGEGVEFGKTVYIFVQMRDIAQNGKKPYNTYEVFVSGAEDGALPSLSVTLYITEDELSIFDVSDYVSARDEIKSRRDDLIQEIKTAVETINNVKNVDIGFIPDDIIEINFQPFIRDLIQFIVLAGKPDRAKKKRVVNEEIGGTP